MQPPTPEDIEQAVAQSGFPAQFAVAQELLRIGYEVHPAYHFFSKSKGRDAEIDILAMREKMMTFKEHDISITTRVGVEVKDSEHPYIIFGLQRAPRVNPAMLDPDSFYCQIQTTRDRGLWNRFGLAVFMPSGNPGFSKDQHHQLSSGERFYTVTMMDRMKNGGWKLHTPQKLWHALSTLGSFAYVLMDQWRDFTKTGEAEKLGGGTLRIFANFFMLVHRGVHYRYSLPQGSLQPASLTSVLFAHTEPGSSHGAVIDFVDVAELETAFRQIEATVDAMVPNLIPLILRSP